MRIHSVKVVAFLITIAIIWIYWAANIQTNKTLQFLKTVNTVKNQLYEPFIKPTVIPCGLLWTFSEAVFLMIIVTSYVGHVELRSAHRRAMSYDFLKSLNATRVFLLARIPKLEKYITQEAIVDESNTFGDIIQGSFIENYRNLTHKHLFGLHWASTGCNKASYILKVDDDTVFNLKRTYNFLLTLKNIDKENFLMGYILNNTKPKRIKENKWYVTKNEYSQNEYPPYLSGWYYITTPEVAARLYQESVHHPYFWIDDIYVTGLLANALKLNHRQLPENYWLEYYELVECCLRDMIKKFIICDYVVGPNGGRNNLLLEFNEAIKHCDIWQNCTIRNAKVPLKSACIGYRERTIFSDGKAEVESVKI